MKVYIPIKIKPIGNILENRFSKKDRLKTYKNYMHLFLFNKVDRASISLPCIVTMTRIAPRAWDEDNYMYSMKGIKDLIADWLIPGLPMGHADGKKEITWEYRQEYRKPKEYALEIEIRPREKI